MPNFNWNRKSRHLICRSTLVTFLNTAFNGKWIFKQICIHCAYWNCCFKTILWWILILPAVLKLLKMAKGIRALLDTVMQALPQVGNLGLLFFLLFFIFAALGVELFGRLGKYRWIFVNRILNLPFLTTLNRVTL